MPVESGVTDTIVVGGGPAGLMAAETLAAAGATVTVFERRRSVGRTLLLAGRSGLNLTHSESVELFADRYDDPEWIRPMLDTFGHADLRQWSADLGEATFEGSTGRVFPEAHRATPLLRAWTKRLLELGVRFERGYEWLGWSDDGSRHRLASGDGSQIELTARVAVLALGGGSWPHVGGDGGWVRILEAAGVRVVPLVASNVGVVVQWSPVFAERFAGTPLKNVAVTVDGRTVRGDVTVTATGLESGPIYTVGPEVRAALRRGHPARLSIDLHPDQTIDQLVDRLARRRAKDSAANWLRRALGLDPVAVNLLREVAPDGRLPTEPRAVAAAVKSAAVAVEALGAVERAISTAGGIARDELTDDLMIRRRPGTFVAGEMIDWDAPTGGYLLQACFSTAVVAARGASKWSRARRDGSRSLTGDAG